MGAEVKCSVLRLYRCLRHFYRSPDKTAGPCVWTLPPLPALPLSSCRLLPLARLPPYLPAGPDTPRGSVNAPQALCVDVAGGIPEAEGVDIKCVGVCVGECGCCRRDSRGSRCGDGLVFVYGGGDGVTA